MVYYFTFLINNEIQYRTQIQSLQCTDHTKKGARCKRRCVIGSSYCSTHLMYDHHLQIKISTILNAGKGLFARNPLSSDANEVIFKKNEIIVKYNGEIINTEEKVHRYANKTAPYTIGISNGVYEDGARVRGIGSLANTLPNHNNATISIHAGRASLRATKPIRNGQEILLSYGPQYQVNQPGVTSTTTTR